MNRLSCNQSQKSMLMNETAFPGTAVNTIAIRMYFSKCAAHAVCRAVNYVIDHTAVFGLRLTQDVSEVLFFTDTRQRENYCTLQPEQSRESAEEFCRAAEVEPFVGFPECVLYTAAVIPLAEGGSLLSFRFHHVLIDGYSMCQIAQRILDVLGGKTLSEHDMCIGEESAAPDSTEETNFWLDYFRGVQFESRILPGNPTGYRRTCYRYALTEELTAQIDRFAQAHQMTAASVFSGAFALYLAGAGQSADAVFLMPRLNRDTQSLREVVGCHTLVVPVRIPVKEDAFFSDLCKTALLQARKASAHKRYGMDRILSDLKNEGIADETLSEYALNVYRPVLHADIPFEIHLSMDGAMYNHLTINITRLKNTYELCYDGRDGVYSAEQIDYFHAAYAGILEKGIGENPKPSAVSLVGEREHADLLDVKGPSVPISDTDSIPSLFQRAVLQYGDRPALYAGKDRLSFTELDRLSNRVANALVNRGVRPGEPIIYMLNRDIAPIPVMLGILKAGAAFIPVDPQYPKERIDYIINNSHAAILVSSQNVEGSLNFPYLEADDLLGWEDDSGDFPEIPQEQLAYCIYTSGTTGKPRGVMLSHRGIVNITHRENNPFNRVICKHGKGIVAIGSFCFDISLFEIFVPLFNGLFVELAPASALADPRLLAERITAHGADILHCTPSRLAAYLHNDIFAKALKSIRMILAAGEVLPAALVQELDETYGIRVYNGYGPTETTIGATITDANDTQTIGRPIANTGVLILDRAGRLLPFGATGEIGVYGDGVGIGYADQPEKTAQQFVNLHNRRLYKTGDLGQLMSDGRLLYRGRNDHQVKLRGLRIELSEIENRLGAFPGVGMAHVLVRKLAGAPHLVGFYTVKPGWQVDADKLKNSLKGSLPLYMVPDVLKELPDMPQTPGGKTDLRALEAIPVEYVREYRAPTGKAEQAICAAFESVLEVSPVGIGDPFFEIGGDSLHTAELLCEIEARLPGAKISFEDIFHYPTPELLAQYLCAQGSTKMAASPLLKLNYDSIGTLLANGASTLLTKEHMGNVLLTGATGFLGVHILIELLKQPHRWDKIWCLVRSNERLTALKRLRGTLFYYSEDDYGDFFDERLFVVEGDIADDAIFQNTFEAKIDTVINSAADVSHFAYDDKLDRINTDGVKNLLNLCRKQSAAFVQISTVSVGGIYPVSSAPLTLTEHDLYIGQEIRNQYILSKFMAEYECLRAAADFQTPVRIMRVGNLQGRISDGEFQMNSRTNAFTRQLSSYVKIGAVPTSLHQSSVNFSPVDEVSKMIVALAATDATTGIYHVFPPQEALYSELFGALEKLGHSVQVIDDDEFDKQIALLGQSKEGKALTEGILLERPDMNYRDTAVTDAITTGVLSSLGMTWKPITADYLVKYVAALEELQLFE